MHACISVCVCIYLYLFCIYIQDKKQAHIKLINFKEHKKFKQMLALFPHFPQHRTLFLSIWSLLVPFSKVSMICSCCVIYATFIANIRQKIFGKNCSKTLITLQLCVACQSDKTMVKITGNDLELLLSPSRRGLHVHLLHEEGKFCLWNPRIPYFEVENAVPKDMFLYLSGLPSWFSPALLPLLSTPPRDKHSSWLLCHFVFSKNVGFFWFPCFLFPAGYRTYVSVVNTSWVGSFFLNLLWKLREKLLLLPPFGHLFFG